MFFLSKTTAELGGTLAIRAKYRSAEYSNRARLNRVKTLDGSSAFSHYGVTDTDRDILVETILAPAAAVKLRDMFESSQPLRLSWSEGSFLGYINDLRIGRDREAVATLYIKEKLTA